MDIYIYFGNSSASNYSNGENTFQFFEDFDSDKSWQNIGGGNGSYTLDNSIITMTETQAGTGLDYTLKLVDSFSVNGDGSQMVMARVKITVAKEVHAIGFTTDVNNKNYHYKLYGSQAWGLSMEQPLTSDNEWQVAYAILNDFSGDRPITIGEDDDSSHSAEQQFDWVFVRKYTDIEPAFSSVGTIEIEGTISGQVTLNGNPIQGAKVRAICQDDNSYAGDTTTDVNGNYEITGLDKTKKYHIIVEYTDPDTGQKYNAESKWDITPVEESS